MKAISQLRTARLLLREWRDEDLLPFAQMGQDPAVMAHFPELLSRELSDAMVARVRAHFEQHGYGMWAAELPGTAPFIGFIGLNVPAFAAHFTPCVEIGWRLASAHHGKGYATEGAREVLRFAFEELALPEVVALTVPANTRSRRVMEKLGMSRDPADDFDHPLVPDQSPVKRHVLYRLRAPGS